MTRVFNVCCTVDCSLIVTRVENEQGTRRRSHKLEMTPNSDITNKESHHLQSGKNIQTREQFNCYRSGDDDDNDEHDFLSQNSGWNNDNDKLRRKTSSRLPKQLTACQEEDVLLGRGRVCWVGNQRFQTEVRRNAKRYADANSRYEKAYIVLEIIAKVQAWGGRFLYKPKPSAVAAEKEPFAQKGEPLPNLAIASQCKVRKKVGQVSVDGPDQEHRR